MTGYLAIALLMAQVFGVLWWIFSQGPLEDEFDIFR